MTTWHLFISSKSLIPWWRLYTNFPPRFSGPRLRSGAAQLTLDEVYVMPDNASYYSMTSLTSDFLRSLLSFNAGTDKISVPFEYGPHYRCTPALEQIARAR